MVIETGWLGMFAGMVEWFANPLLLLSWIFAGTRRRFGSSAMRAFARQTDPTDGSALA